jgi:hypothetical protein
MRNNLSNEVGRLVTALPLPRRAINALRQDSCQRIPAKVELNRDKDTGWEDKGMAFQALQGWEIQR